MKKKSKKKNVFGDTVGWSVMALIGNSKVRCTKTLTEEQAVKARLELMDLNASRPKIFFIVSKIVYVGE